MIELNKKRFSSLIKNALNPKFSVEYHANKMDVSADAIYRILGEKEIGLTNFLKVISWLKQEKLLSFDQIFHLILKEEE